MNDKSRNSIIKDLTKAGELFENDDASLRELSDHAIQDVMMYKSLDAVSIAVLIHALYKGRLCINGNKKKRYYHFLNKQRHHFKTDNLVYTILNLKACLRW